MKWSKFFTGSKKTVIGVNTVAQFAGKVASAGVMFLVALIIARSFGADGFGDFTKITTYVAFFYLLADFGLNAVFLQNEQKSDGSWGNLFILRILTSIILIILSLSILFFLPYGSDRGYTYFARLGIILYSPTILFQALITTANALFQKHLRYELATLALVIGDIVSLVLVGLTAFLAVSSGSVVSAVSLMLGAGVTGIVSLILAYRLEKTAKISFSLKAMKELLLGSMPLGIMLIFNQVYFRFDSFVLTLTRSTAEVGLYGFAYKIFEMPLVIPTFFMNAVYPLLLQAKARDQLSEESQLFENLFKKSFKTLLLSSLIIVILFWLAAPLLTLVRPEFSGSELPLRILVLGLPIFFTTSLLMWVIVAVGEQKVLPLVYGISMILIIAADIVFIPKFGYISAALITDLAEISVLMMLGAIVLKLKFGRRKVKIF